MQSASVRDRSGVLALLSLVLFAPLVLGVLGGNGLLTLFVVGTLLVGSWLLWRPGEPPILLLIFTFQWLQASAKVFHANWKGIRIEDIAPLGGSVELAVVLSVIGVMALAFGMRMGAGRVNYGVIALAQTASRSHALRSWFLLYLAAFGCSAVLQAVAWRVPGLTQPLLAAANIKWVFYWMLAYATFVRPGASTGFLLTAFGIELMVGLGGYFAGFRTVFFFTLLALAANPGRLSPGQYVGGASIGAALFLMAVLWTATKSEYRSFVSGGEAAQIVTVDYGDRIVKLAELVGELDGQKIEESVEQLFDRVAYVDFFALVLDQVPNVLPHEGGALWWDAITRPFMPRLFFPDKADVNDSERTNLYSGVGVAGSEQGTAISIGYFAETYIDFGAVMMMPVIFTFGLLLGAIYRWMAVRSSFRGILGMAFAVNILYVAVPLESSITIVFAGVMVIILVSWVVGRFAIPRLVPWLTAFPKQDGGRLQGL